MGEGEDRTRSWIDSIELSDGHPALKFGLGVGVSADTVAATFRLDEAGVVQKILIETVSL